MVYERYAAVFVAMDELSRASPDLSLLRFLETGTGDGVRAAQLIRRWRDLRPGGGAVAYYGFDEFGPPHREREARRRIEATGASVYLADGPVPMALGLAARAMAKMDFILQDSGDDPIAAERQWEQAVKLAGLETVYLLDDYHDDHLDLGCRALVDRLRRNSSYVITLLDPVDRSTTAPGLTTRMVKVCEARGGVP